MSDDTRQSVKRGRGFGRGGARPVGRLALGRSLRSNVITLDWQTIVDPHVLRASVFGPLLRAFKIFMLSEKATLKHVLATPQLAESSMHLWQGLAGRL